jgi:DNA-directed RNA polymerase subunit M/transcription elongation factor TFIIS
MKRTVDRNYFVNSTSAAFSTGIAVKCPKCQGLGVVKTDGYKAYFKCPNCATALTKERTNYRCDVHNLCPKCGRYYRVDIDEESKQHFPALRVACPFCGHMTAGKVHRTRQGFTYYSEVQNGREPFFGFELWFLAYLGRKAVWALNREHLNYLIDYLSADLRQKPAGYFSQHAQADHLPTFMKTAKNRERIVKLLQGMQNR